MSTRLYCYVYLCNIPEDFTDEEFNFVELRVFAKDKKNAEKIVKKINTYSPEIVYAPFYEDKICTLVDRTVQ